MNNQATKIILAIAFTTFICLSAPRWWKKIGVRIRIERAPEGTTPVLEKQDQYFFVQWQDGQKQSNYSSPSNLRTTNRFEVGLKQDGTVVWRPR